MFALLFALPASTEAFAPVAAPRPAVYATRSAVCMQQNEQKSSMLPKTVGSSMQNVAQKKLVWPYVFATGGILLLATGGIFEDQVVQLFEPVTSKGGWSAALNINPPGLDEVQKMKQEKGYTLRGAEERSAPGTVFPEDYA